MKNILRLMLVLFLVVPLGMAGYLVKLGQGSDTTAGLVEESESGFSDGKPFVAEGKLSSPSGESLTSMHQQKPCLAYRIKFDLRHTVTDSDGEEEDRRLELFEERHQVPDLTAEFANGKALLDIQTFTEFYKPHFEELEKLPEYVPYERIPKVKTDRFWFEVFETTLRDERERTIWHERLTASEPVSLTALGKRYGVSKERIRQVEARMKRRLREHLTRELGDEIPIYLETPTD